MYRYRYRYTRALIFPNCTDWLILENGVHVYKTVLKSKLQDFCFESIS